MKDMMISVNYQKPKGLLPSSHDILLVAELVLELLPSEVCLGYPFTGVNTILFNLPGTKLRPLVCQIFVDAKIVGDPWRIGLLCKVKRDTDEI